MIDAIRACAKLNYRSNSAGEICRRVVWSGTEALKCKFNGRNINFGAERACRRSLVKNTGNRVHERKYFRLFKNPLKHFHTTNRHLICKNLLTHQFFVAVARESFWINYFHTDGQSVGNGDKNRIAPVPTESDTVSKKSQISVFSALQASAAEAFTRNAQNRANCRNIDCFLSADKKLACVGADILKLF